MEKIAQLEPQIFPPCRLTFKHFTPLDTFFGWKNYKSKRITLILFYLNQKVFHVKGCERLTGEVSPSEKIRLYSAKV